MNNEKVSAEAEQNDELKRIRIEALNMAQDKEVQNMLIQERYDRMDWLTYGNEREKRGEEKGENKLAALISKLYAISRGSEVETVARDEQYREKLYR